MFPLAPNRLARGKAILRLDGLDEIPAEDAMTMIGRIKKCVTELFVVSRSLPFFYPVESGAIRTRRGGWTGKHGAFSSWTGWMEMLNDIRSLIFTARRQVARAVNAGLTTLYWENGRRILQNILEEKRATYGKEIVAALGRQLEVEFGRGFGEKNLHRMVQFT